MQKKWWKMFTRNNILRKVDVTSRTKLARRKRLSTNHMIKNQSHRLPEGSCSGTRKHGNEGKKIQMEKKSDISIN